MFDRHHSAQGEFLPPPSLRQVSRFFGARDIAWKPFFNMQNRRDRVRLQCQVKIWGIASILLGEDRTFSCEIGRGSLHQERTPHPCTFIRVSTTGPTTGPDGLHSVQAYQRYTSDAVTPETRRNSAYRVTFRFLDPALPVLLCRSSPPQLLQHSAWSANQPLLPCLCYIRARIGTCCLAT